MSIYTDAIETVKKAHLEAMGTFMGKYFPELAVDEKQLKADFEQYFNEGTEQGELLEQQLLQKYGPDQFERQWTLRARKAERRNG